MKFRKIIWNKNQHAWDTMCTIFQTKRTSLTFWAQICLKMDFRVKISKTYVWTRNQHPWDTMCTNFQRKQRTLNFGPKLPKNGFWGRNFKNLNLDSESASLRHYVHQFSDKTDNFQFLGPNLPKSEFQGRNFKNLSLDSESAPPVYHVCQFSIKMDNF